MYACAEVLFQNAAEKIIDTRIFDCYKFGVKNCEEIKLNDSVISMHVGVSFIDQSVSACMKIKFYNNENEIIDYQHLQLFEFQSNWKKIEIPEDSTSVIVCFTTEYKQCENCVQ